MLSRQNNNLKNYDLTQKRNVYRYVITKATINDDLSNLTFKRRTQKKEQSKAPEFLFDLTDLDTEDLNLHIHQIQKLDGLFLFSALSDFNYDQIQCKKYILIQTAAEFYQVQNFNDMTSVFNPRTLNNATDLIHTKNQNPNLCIEWFFSNYDSQIKRSLTLENVHDLILKNNLQISDLPFWNTHIPANYELECLEKPSWSVATPDTQNIKISVIIPTYNNCVFLCNVIQHLIEQTISNELYEIIIVDDGSSDNTNETLCALLQRFKQQINLKYIYWPKNSPTRGEQKFFRAGLARNCGVANTNMNSNYLFFLDSDMLVPSDFIETILAEFKNSDILQFSRLHLTQKISKKNPPFSAINFKTDTYIEEKNYWTQLFDSKNWPELKNHWKFTCTYALGLSKANFYDCGRFKRHFVSYGLEDTDLGFLMSKKHKKFKLIQKPILHLTNYSSMQYQNSKFIRDQLLRKTAKLFYLDHLDSEIFEVFKFYYQFERSLLRWIKDLF